MSDGADLPYFKFFVADWLSDLNVRAMDPATRGIYADLLAFDWREDGIPDDPEFLARALGVDADRMRTAYDTLSGRFVPHPEKDGHVTNRRLLKERNEIRSQADKRSEAARKAAEARWAKEKEGDGDASDAGRSANGVRSQGDTRSREMSESESEGEKRREEKDMGDGDDAPPPESETTETSYVHAPPDEWPVASELDEDSGGHLIYPREFEEVWSDRVPRDGSNPKKRGYRQYRKSRRDGMSREQAELALDYRRREAERKGDVGERHVEQFATFFGQDDLWRDYLERPDPADVHDMSQADRRLAKRRAELEADDLEQVPI